MTIPAAVTDTNWLNPIELYLDRAPECKVERPIYQGDVFHSVNLPQLPNNPVEDASATINFTEGLCMVVPHPCQCYHGDNLRPRLTVAPVTSVQDYNNFKDDFSGAKDKFALPELRIPAPDGTWKNSACVADFGRLQTISSKWLPSAKRIAYLSHEGLGLLAKRILGFQLRYPITLANAMAYTANEWNESFLMEAWVKENKRLKGYASWLRTPIRIPGINGGNPVAPYDIRSALDVLLELITGQAIVEPAD